MISGSVIRRKVCHGVAPRSCAASSSERSKPISRERTVTITNDRLNMMWAITIVVKPVATAKLRNIDSSAAPSTTSGVASGMKMKKLTGARPRNS